MTDSQIDVALVERNFAAFEKYAGRGYLVSLRDHKPVSKLVRNEDGDWDVEFRGELLYGPGGRARAEGMAKHYSNSNTRFKLGALTTSNLDRGAGDFVFHLLKRATEGGITFNQSPTTEEGFHLISFGLGLGYHLPNLIEMTQCECLCIVEPNMDFLYHSMAVMDWTPLLERNQGWPFVSMITEKGLMAELVRSQVRNSNPTSVDGALIVSAYPNDQMAAAQREFVRDANMCMVGLGFMVDEAEMARASYLNLCEGSYRLYKQRKARNRVPAFVIGSGPSIDNDIEIIKELQDRAAIFACGTSARILLANGIQPDFMLLLENGEVPYGAMEKVAKTYDVGDAVMIASNTVSQKIKSLCKETVFFIRPSLCPYPIFSHGAEYSFPSSGPTVANTGLGAALTLGFNEVYLFGVDLGSRDPNRHHSSHSAYVRKETDAPDAEILPFDAVFDRPAVGNFGGVIHTELIMEWTRDALERVAGDFKRSSIVYNCSDGARIENTIAKSAEAIELTVTPEQKRADLEAVMKDLPKATGEEALARWNAADGLGQIRELCGQFKAELEDFPASAPAFVRKLLPLIMPDRLRTPNFGQFFIRGTFFMSIAAADYYLRRVTHAEDRKRFETMICEEFCRLSDNTIRWAEWFFDNMTTYESSIDLERDFSELPYE